MTYYSVSGYFEGRGDVDWYRVYLEGGQSYYLQGADQGSLRTAAGDIVMLDYQKAYIAQSGWYFVEAKSTSTGPGGYEMSIESLPDDGIAGNTRTTRTISLAAPVTITRTTDFALNDDDWFAFDATAGQGYLFGGKNLYDSGALHLKVYDASGTEVSDDGYFSAAASGRYFVGVDRDFASSYTLTMSAVADDHGEAITGAGSLTIGVEQTARFEVVGDRDWFRMELTGGQSYLLSGNWASYGVADATGAVVKPADGGNGLFSAATSGTYFLIAKFEGQASQAPVDYHFTVSSIAGELADNVTTKGVLSVGTASTSKFDASGDSDWFAVKAQAGASYQIVGDNGAVFRVYDGAGHQISGDYAGTFTAAVTGTYYVAARQQGFGGPSYSVSLSTYADDYAASAATTGHAVVGQPVTGRFEVDGDTDWFAMELQAGVTYIAGDGFVLGAFRDASGALLSGPNNGNAFTPTVSGTYYLEVYAGPKDYSLYVRALTGDVPGDASTTVEMPAYFYGTSGDDRAAGGAHADHMLGNAGNDRLYGLDGNDELEGGDGNDLLTGGAGNDILDGGAGVNRLIGEDGDDEMRAFEGSATMTGGAGNDIYVIGAGIHVTVVEKAGGGIDTIRTDAPSLTLRSEVENLEGWAEGTGQTLTGNTLANRIAGSYGNDIISGGAASDTLYGNGGNDRLIGGDGADTLYGGSGDDLIRGGTGSDLLSGGAGADRFLFIPGDLGVSGDRITDFSQTEGDRMDLSGYGPLKFIGTGAFSGVAGQFRATLGATSTLVQGDLNGDKVVDFAIRLDGQFLLAKSDFVLATGSSAPIVDAFSLTHAGSIAGPDSAWHPVDLLHFTPV